MPTPQTRVAIVTPVYRAECTPDEQVSFRHLDRHLGAYDRFLVAPYGLDVRRPGFAVRRFGAEYFRSPKTYSALLVSRAFFRAFADYEYILIYQPDALVLSDQLLAWCARGYDYVGAPWFPCAYTPNVTYAHAGNGGFSLRNVAAHLRVLESRALAETYWIDPDDYWASVCAEQSGVRRLARLPRRYLKRLHAFNSVRRTLARALEEPDLVVEDEFWSREATKYDPAFRVAPVEAAVHFAFEAEPRRCLQMTGGALPFGCHAWDRVDRAFWEPYLDAPVRVPARATPLPSRFAPRRQGVPQTA